MTFTTEDRVQAWSEFLIWWQRWESVSEDNDNVTKNAAGAAWLAAWEQASKLRGDD